MAIVKRSAAAMASPAVKADAPKPRRKQWILPEVELPTGPSEISDDVRDYSIFIHGEKKIGKDQPLDSLILTPEGFVPMRDVCVGSQVIGSFGKAVSVLGVYPQPGERQVFKVSFSDGTFVECGEGHLWFTQNWAERKAGLPGSVKDTKTILDTLLQSRGNTALYSHHVPWTSPVVFEKSASLAIDPYVFGALLGDGSFVNTCITFCNPESDVVAAVAAGLPESDKLSEAFDVERCPTYRVVMQKQAWGGSAVRQALESWGLFGKSSEGKFIPREYLFASPKQRLQVLQGLCDTDGYVGNKNLVEFSTASKQLADDVAWLVRSLGGWCRVSSRQPFHTYKGEKLAGQTAHRLWIRFYNGIVPVSSIKHLKRWVTPKRALGKVIVAVQKCRTAKTQCIKVDSPDGLYVTDGFTVTHNTTLFSEEKGALFIEFDPPQRALAIEQVYCPDWNHYLAFQEKLVAKCKYKTVVIDRADLMYVQCMIEVCNRLGIDHPQDLGFGKGWSAVRREFQAAVSTIMGIVPTRWIAHSALREKEARDGQKIDRFGPDFPSQADSVLTGLMDITGAYTYGGESGRERILIISGDETMVAGHRISGHFLTPKGRHVIEIPMGESSDEAYANFMRAFNNEQPFATIKERDARKEGAKKPKA